MATHITEKSSQITAGTGLNHRNHQTLVTLLNYRVVEALKDPRAHALLLKYCQQAAERTVSISGQETPTCSIQSKMPWRRRLLHLSL
jgi:hypothetical protein